MADERFETLRKVALFEGLSDRELEAVAHAAKERRFDTGDTVVVEGEGGVGFFVVADGTARVEAHGQRLGTISPGELVRRGGAARRRAAAAARRSIAESPLRVYGLTAWQFTPLLEQYPSIAVKIAKHARAPAARGARSGRRRRLTSADTVSRDRARRGDSGSLYRQSALAGLNSRPEGRSGSGEGLRSSVSIARSHATEACEPRQVRKEAALSNVTRVPWASLAGACGASTARDRRFEGGCTVAFTPRCPPRPRRSVHRRHR